MKEKYGEIVSVSLLPGHVAEVVIDRPPNNHVSVTLMSELADALEDLDKAPGCRATVLRTEGKAFCAGADLVARDGDHGIENETGNPLYDQAVRLYAVEKPIVVAVQGAAVGAGLGLALIGDFRVAAPEARFAANFTRLGFHPGFGLTHTLPRLIGQGRASLMFLTSRRVKAEAALAWGLVDEIAPLDQLREAALTLAREIAENAPLAVVATRKTLRGDLARAVRTATDHEFQEQNWLRKTEDFAEGIRSVNERRVGNFTGR